MTNGELIKNMTLAEQIAIVGTTGICSSISHCRDKHCVRCIEKWLKEEVEEDD